MRMVAEVWEQAVRGSALSEMGQKQPHSMAKEIISIFQGSIDELSIYSQALTPIEIGNEYQRYLNSDENLKSPKNAPQPEFVIYKALRHSCN